MKIYEYVLGLVEEEVESDDSLTHEQKHQLCDVVESFRNDRELFLDTIQVFCIGMARSTLFLSLILGLVGIPVIDATGDKKETVH